MKAYLSISLDRIIVLAPSIPHFTGLGIRNLQYQIRITNFMCGSNFYETDVSVVDNQT